MVFNLVWQRGISRAGLGYDLESKQLFLDFFFTASGLYHTAKINKFWMQAEFLV